MGVDTKGVLVTPIKDVFLVTSLIERSLNKLVMDARHLEFKERIPFVSARARKLYRTPEFRLLPNSEGVQVNLCIRGYSRMLTLHFHCDMDHLDLGPASISMSMSSFGHSDIIVQAALYALSLLGKVYYQREDTGYTPLAELAAPSLTLPEALSLGFVTAYPFSKWAKRHLAGTGNFVGDFEEVFGCTPEWFLTNDQSEDIGEGWRRLEKQVHRDVVLPDFWPTQLSDYGDANPEVLAAVALAEADEVQFAAIPVKASRKAPRS